MVFSKLALKVALFNSKPLWEQFNQHWVVLYLFLFHSIVFLWSPSRLQNTQNKLEMAGLHRNCWNVFQRWQYLTETIFDNSIAMSAFRISQNPYHSIIDSAFNVLLLNAVNIGINWDSLRYFQVRGKTLRGWGEFSHSLSATTGHTGGYTSHSQMSLKCFFFTKVSFYKENLNLFKHKVKKKDDYQRFYIIIWKKK